MDRWLNFQINDSDHFIIKFCCNHDDTTESVATCWLSNFTSLWTESITTKSELLDRFFAENGVIDRSSEGIEKQVLDTIGTLPPDSKHIEISIDNNNEDDQIITLKFKYILSGIPVRFHWKLTKSDSKQFFDVITKSIFQQLFELQNRNEELVQIIKSKDLEIEQYKLDGAKPLMRKQFITRPFDENDYPKPFQIVDCQNADITKKFDLKRKETSPQKNEEENATEGNGNEKIQNAIIKKSSGRTRSNKRHRGFNINHSFAVPSKFEYQDDEDPNSQLDQDIESEQIEQSIQLASKNDKILAKKGVRRDFNI